MKQFNNVPKHVAIIMDGNRRWAREKGLPILAGHQKVAHEILEPLIEYADNLGIKYITFWAFSTENWQRSQTEVAGIMRIFRHVIKRRWAKLHEKGVRIKVIGDISKFSKDIKEALEKVIEQTKDNKKITTVFALNYGGRDEILRAMQKMTNTVFKSAKNLDQALQQFNNLTIKQFGDCLDTVGIPEPELIVRTGGEQRLSGFLLWQSEYSELYFPKWYMPEFTPEKLDEVLEKYAGRQRRFGK